MMVGARQGARARAKGELAAIIDEQRRVERIAGRHLNGPEGVLVSRPVASVQPQRLCRMEYLGAER